MRPLVCLVGVLFLAMSGVLAAFALRPLNAEAEYQRGRAAYDVEDYKKADGHLARALEADSGNVSFLFARVEAGWRWAMPKGRRPTWTMP